MKKLLLSSFCGLFCCLLLAQEFPSQKSLEHALATGDRMECTSLIVKLLGAKPLVEKGSADYYNINFFLIALYERTEQYEKVKPLALQLREAYLSGGKEVLAERRNQEDLRDFYLYILETLMGCSEREKDVLQIKALEKEILAILKGASAKQIIYSRNTIASAYLSLGDLKKAHRLIKMSFSDLKTHQWTEAEERLVTTSTTTVYSKILKELLKFSAKQGSRRTVNSLLGEMTSLADDFPSSPIGLYLDCEVIVGIMENSTLKTDRENRALLQDLVETYRNGFVANAKIGGEDVSQYDNPVFISKLYGAICQHAIENNSPLSEFFLKVSADYCHIQRLPIEDVEYSWGQLGQYYLKKERFVEAFETFEKLLKAQQISKSNNVNVTHHWLVEVTAASTYCLRKFTKKSVGSYEDKEHDYIPLVSFEDANTILDKWMVLTEEITTDYGREYFDELIASRDPNTNQRVFPYYSPADTKLMKAHNYIRMSEYDEAFRIIEHLIDAHVLSDDKIMDMIWEIDENMCVHSGLKDVNGFLNAIGETQWVKNRPDVAVFVSYEKERAQEWLMHSINVAREMSGNGEFDRAANKYDYILTQVEYMPNPDSLYVVVQNFRGWDLFLTEKYEESLKAALQADSVMRKSNCKFTNHFRRNNLILISCGYEKEENFKQALVYNDENISLLTDYKRNKTDVVFLCDFEQAYSQRAKYQIKLKDYEAAEKTCNLYLNFLKNSEDLLIHSTQNSQENLFYSKFIIITHLSEIYSNRLEDAIKESDVESCLEIFNKVFNLYTSYPRESTASYSLYFSHFKDHNEWILALIKDEEEVKAFCDKNIELANLIYGEKSKLKQTPQFDFSDQMAVAIDDMGLKCEKTNHPQSAIHYHQQAIDYIIEHQGDSGAERIGKIRCLIAGIYDREGRWDLALKEEIQAFNSFVVAYGVDSAESQQRFDLAHIAFQNALYYNCDVYSYGKLNNLSYEESIELLSTWRGFINDIKDKYGEIYLKELYSFIVNRMNSYSSATFIANYEEKLTFDSEVDYYEVLLSIKNNRLVEFKSVYSHFLENLASYDSSEDIEELKYHLVVSISNSLVENGFFDWSRSILYTYQEYLLSNKTSQSCVLFERIETKRCFIAIAMNDVEELCRLTMAARYAMEKNAISLFWDLNECVLQIICYSRALQELQEKKQAFEALLFAENLVESRHYLRTERPVSITTLSTLYNDLAIQSETHEQKIKYYQKAINVQDDNMIAKINLASEYKYVGKYAEADSILTELYNYSKEHYMAPKAKQSMLFELAETTYALKDFSKTIGYLSEYISITTLFYLNGSHSLTSRDRSRFWDKMIYGDLRWVSTMELGCGNYGDNSYNAALFQKSILARQQQAVATNIMNSDDEKLKRAFESYKRIVRENADSALVAEYKCMYLYSLHSEFIESFKIPTWQDVQQTLDKKELAIEYSMALYSNEIYYVALLLRKGWANPLIIPLCPRKQLLDIVKQNVDELTGFSKSTYEEGVLYDLLWKPIEKYLRGVKTIYYAPDDYLYNINLGAASEKHQKKSIGDKYRLYRVSSTSMLPNVTAGSFQNATLYGNLDYDAKVFASSDSLVSSSSVSDYSNLRGSMGHGWGALDHTLTEITDIQKQLVSNQVSTVLYTQEQGTENTFKRLSGESPEILHLATHGYYYSADDADKVLYFNKDEKEKNINYAGARSGIVLSGGNHAWNGEPIPVGVDDGILTADEVCGMDLSKTKLLTLSACQTALGDLGSDGVYGIQRSFKIAGVGSIIMSLWQVSDEATCLMMSKFYEELATGKSCQEAFAMAQKTIKSWAEKKVEKERSEIIKEYANIPEKKEQSLSKLLPPEYYWAPFVILD